MSSRCLELVDSTIDTHELLHRSLAVLRQFEPTIEISEGTGSALLRLRTTFCFRFFPHGGPKPANCCSKVAAQRAQTPTAEQEQRDGQNNDELPYPDTCYAHDVASCR